jgi:hypothetical protein
MRLAGSRGRGALAGFAFAGGSFTTDAATTVPLLREARSR